MNSLQFTTALNTLAWSIAEQFDTAESLGLAGAVLTQLGDTLETIAALRAAKQQEAPEAEQTSSLCL